MFASATRKIASPRQPSSTRRAAGLVIRLKDPQVWVCAIAAFTLIGLSSGLLGAADQAPQQQAQLLASAK